MACSRLVLALALLVVASSPAAAVWLFKLGREPSPAMQPRGEGAGIFGRVKGASASRQAETESSEEGMMQQPTESFRLKHTSGRRAPHRALSPPTVPSSTS